MKVLKLVFLGISLGIIAFAIVHRASKLPGQIAGTVANPLLVDNKFCSDPASPNQTGCVSFIASALAQTMSSPYQNVSGDVSISGNVGIGTANPGAKLAVDASGVNTGIFIGSGGTNAYGASLLEINAPAGYGNYIFEIGKNYSGIFHIDANGNEYAVTNNATSDRRLKTNITPLTEDNGLSAINQLKPVTFNWLSQDYAKTEQIGLIAQDVEKVFPQLVSEGGTTTIQLAGGDSQTVNGTKSLNYSGLIPSLVKAIQELEARTQYIQNAGGKLISNIASFNKLIADKIQAGVIEAKQMIINGVDILERLNSLSQKVEAQQKEIDLLKQEIETLKAR